MNELKEDYEIEASDAVKMILCMFAGMNAAIEMGTGTEKTQVPI
jgi:hypothetical protein